MSWCEWQSARLDEKARWETCCTLQNIQWYKNQFISKRWQPVTLWITSEQRTSWCVKLSRKRKWQSQWKYVTWYKSKLTAVGYKDTEHTTQLSMTYWIGRTYECHIWIRETKINYKTYKLTCESLSPIPPNLYPKWHPITYNILYIAILLPRGPGQNCTISEVGCHLGYTSVKLLTLNGPIGFSGDGCIAAMLTPWLVEPERDTHPKSQINP